MSTFTRAQFQEAAVNHIVGRLRDKTGSRRVLLADEVGLGKTVVARGVIERLLERRRRPLTVVYLCSNSDIAEQNRIKLDPESEKPIGRVTELALARHQGARRLLLYSFTPGTSLKEGTGLAWERRLLLYLLHRIYGFPVGTKAWREYFRCGAGEAHWTDATTRGRLSTEFERKTERAFQTELAAAWRETMFDGQRAVFAARDLVATFSYHDHAVRSQRNRLIARLRGVMQRVALRYLDPDLVILDEVQRFRDVIDAGSEKQGIASELFARRAPVIILSATPYRALTLGHEVAEGAKSHHEDFHKTLAFLFDRDTETPKKIRTNLTVFGAQLERPDLADRLDLGVVALKRAIEADLTKVICRTERNWYVLDHQKGVDDEGGTRGALPSSGELEEFFWLHRALATSSPMGQVTEFWKSAPSLLTFLDSKYALLKRVQAEKVRVPKELLTRADDVSSLAARNHRISKVVDVALGSSTDPPRLWTRPTYLYHQDKFFLERDPRKLLVFSGWRFVPKAVAIVASRAAIDRLAPQEGEATQPLRFTERRSFHVFDVCFPAPTLAQVGHEAMSELLSVGLPEAEDVLGATQRLLMARLLDAGIRVVPQGGSSLWAVVMRLEQKERQRLDDSPGRGHVGRRRPGGCCVRFRCPTPRLG
jgi:hypothetical protein